jgi:hypothetical protein
MSYLVGCIPNPWLQLNALLISLSIFSFSSEPTWVPGAICAEESHVIGNVPLHIFATLALQLLVPIIYATELLTLFTTATPIIV